MNEDIELQNILNNLNNTDNLNNLRYLNDMHDQNFARKYTVRNRLNPFTEYNNEEFERRFRFTKSEVRMIYDFINGKQTLEPMVNFIDKNLFEISFYEFQCEKVKKWKNEW